MALFSDVDWFVIAVVAAFLFLGPQGQQFVRQLGRWYGRLNQLKAEIMNEVTASAGLTPKSGSPPAALRSVLLGPEGSETAPSALRAPSPNPGVITRVLPVDAWAVDTQSLGAGIGPGTWWVTSTSAPGEVVRLR